MLRRTMIGLALFSMMFVEMSFAQCSGGGLFGGGFLGRQRRLDRRAARQEARMERRAYRYSNVGYAGCAGQVVYPSTNNVIPYQK